VKPQPVDAGRALTNPKNLLLVRSAPIGAASSSAKHIVLGLADSCEKLAEKAQTRNTIRKFDNR
jgi:hypothetical protein